MVFEMTQWKQLAKQIVHGNEMVASKMLKMMQRTSQMKMMQKQQDLLEEMRKVMLHPSHFDSTTSTR